MTSYLPLISVLILNASLALPLAAESLDPDGDGVPDAAGALLGADPMAADKDGGGVNDLADEDGAPMPNPSVIDGPDALAENNKVLAAKPDAGDLLEGLIRDAGTTNGTFPTLHGVTVPAGGEARIHVGDGGAAGQFRADPDLIHRASDAANTYAVPVSLTGFAPARSSSDSSKGVPGLPIDGPLLRRENLTNL